MAATTPEFLGRSGIEPGLIATIVLSAGLHAGAVIFLLTVPGQFLSVPKAPVSYTVDLIAADAIGGTNLIPGKKAAPKMPAAPVGPVAPKLAEPKAAEPKPAAPVVAPVAEPPPVAKLPEPPKAAEPPKVAEPPKALEPPKVVEPPKAVEPQKAAEPAKPAAVPPPPKAVKPEVVPKAPPLADAKPPEAKPVAKPAPAAKPAEKPAEQKPAAQKADSAKGVSEDAVKPSTKQAKADAEAKPAAAQPDTPARDQQIADAIQRRAAQVQGEPRATGKKVDEQIAAAVQRRASQVQTGTGSGEPGGPISVGPGVGSGGTPADLQYILYQGRMEERIKAAWAWAGADKALQAVIQFNLTPDGEIRNVRTIESSGDRQYDTSCERAVRAVDRLEPIPDKYREAFATVQMTFKPTDLGQ